jgi:type IV pilus assembly protein PilW
MKNTQKTSHFENIRSSALGFSLIELMVAMLIGVLVLTGVIQVIFNSKRSYVDNQEIAFIQDNTRYALDIIAKDFRSAGYRGCANNEPNLVNVINNASVASIADAFALQSLTAFEGQTPANIVNYNTLPAPDSITLRTVSNENEIKLRAHSPQASTLTTWQNITYPVGTPLVVVDTSCQSVALIMADNVAAQTITYGASKNCSSALTSVDPFNCTTAVQPRSVKPLSSGASIFPYVANTYFIGASNTLANMPALKRRFINVAAGDISYSTEEIAQGVENMQITYGVDADQNNAIDGIFVDANVITAGNNWNRVVAMNIVLTLRSNLRVGNTGQADGYLRRTVASTISLRNRGT